MNHSGWKNNSLQLSLTVFFQGRVGSTAMVGRDGDLCPWVGAATRGRMVCGHRSQPARAARFDVPPCPRDAAATGLRTVDSGARAACFDGPRPAVSSRCCGHWVEDGGARASAAGGVVAVLIGWASSWAWCVDGVVRLGARSWAWWRRWSAERDRGPVVEVPIELFVMREGKWKRISHVRVVCRPSNTERIWGVGYFNCRAEMSWMGLSGSFFSSGDTDYSVYEIKSVTSRRHTIML
jgi:hypothetical protein